MKMNWEDAKTSLRNGFKITRPNWEQNNFWVLSKDRFERILCHDGTCARVHLQQTEANDWEIWEEEITSGRIQKAITSFLLKSVNHPNVIKFGGVRESFIGVGMSLYGMKIKCDESLKEGEFYVSYEEPRIKCFWCERYVTNIVEHTNEMHPGLSPRSYDFIKEKLC